MFIFDASWICTLCVQEVFDKSTRVRCTKIDIIKESTTLGIRNPSNNAFLNFDNRLFFPY